ncbi:MAG TPA: peptidoglycan recognition family protein [Polyangiales bacterium]|jgi:N-acetyl-anhydromuramyl-L-alanine amidase AmpD
MISPPPLPAVPVIVAVDAPLVIKERPAHRANFSSLQRPRTQFITIHCTGGHEGFRAGDPVAAMFADPMLTPHRSAHYVIDAGSATRCVPDMLTAWHGGHHANQLSIGVELCGSASQSRAQWLDDASLRTLNIAARAVAGLCAVHKIPPQVVNDRGLVNGMQGITTHSFVSQAWHESDHYDPGSGFPLGAFVIAVAKAMLVIG